MWNHQTCHNYDNQYQFTIWKLIIHCNFRIRKSKYNIHTTDTNDQKKLAVESKKKIQLSITNLIVTKISPAKEFYLAEDYHQLFIKKRA